MPPGAENLPGLIATRELRVNQTWQPQPQKARVGDAKAAYNALLRWLECTHQGPDSATIEDFLVHHPDADLRRQVEGLQESILGTAANWKGATLADALRRAHRRRLRRRTAADEARLPALNPRWPPTLPPAQCWTYVAPLAAVIVAQEYVLLY
jgi:hypothetical protein